MWDDAVVVVVKHWLMTTLRHREERNWPQARRNLQPTLDEVLPKLLQEVESGPRDWNRFRPAVARWRGGKPGRRIAPPTGRIAGAIAVIRCRDSSRSTVSTTATPAGDGLRRHRDAEQLLIKQFASHSIERAYLAVVHGQPAEGTINRRLIRDRGDGLHAGSHRLRDRR
ncbi:MAG: hypothetical protein R3B90_03915 [Planctomycetaceae bacterium]